MATNIETGVEREASTREELKELENDVRNANSSIDLNLKRARLTKRKGVFEGPSGRETYYNLKMNKVVKYMANLGYTESKGYKYHVRADGVKMLGDYVMVAANLKIRPKGTILQTSLGMGIVCDSGSFTKKYPKGLDVATNW